MSFFRRLSKSDRDRDRDRGDNRLSHHSDRGPISPTSPPTSYNIPNGLPRHGQDQHHSRPASSTAMSDASYDFATHQNTNYIPNTATTTTTTTNNHHNSIISPTNQQNASHRFVNNPPPSTSRPISHAMPPAAGSTSSGSGGTVGNLSRTDQVVLRYFWDAKTEENSTRDLHFLKFPSFGPAPSDRELVPFCEIYALVKNSKGAQIVGVGTLGGGSGTFIGFELFSSAQLHIDLSDQWTVPISHHRVFFKSFDALIHEASSAAAAAAAAAAPHRSSAPVATATTAIATATTTTIIEQMRGWPKPLTIEFLEEMYAERWAGDLNALCWESREVKELGGGSGGGGSAAGGEGVPGGGGGAGGDNGGLGVKSQDEQEEFVH